MKITDHLLSKLKKLQRLAYQAAQSTHSQLEEGMTEKDAANLIDQFMKSNGIDRYFHHPYAWFGDRTKFMGIEHPQLGFEFLPSDLKLKKGMSVILDVAPIQDGWPVDIGYSFCFKEENKYDSIFKNLNELRNIILDMAIKRETMASIYRECDRYFKENQMTNCHAVYPLGVLGHKLFPIPGQAIPQINFLGFQPQVLLTLGSKSLFSKFFNKSETPYWNESCHHPLANGLWAVEPHFGTEDYGAKFEEILVVDGNSIYWLDNDLPHVLSS